MTFRLEEWMRVVRRHRFPALTVWSGELRVGKARDWESAALAGTSETVRDRLACWLRDERAGRRLLRVSGDGAVRRVIGIAAASDDIEKVDEVDAAPLWAALAIAGVEGKVTRTDGVRWFARGRVEEGQWKADRARVFELKKGACSAADEARVAGLSALMADIAPDVEAWVGSNAEALFRLEHSGHFGLVDADGRVALAPIHTGLGDVHEGCVATTSDDGAVLRDLAGRALLEGWNGLGACNGGLVPVTRVEGPHGRAGYARVSGEIVIAPQSEHAFPFVGDVALTQRQDSARGAYYRFVDRRGNDVGPAFDHTLGFSEGLAWVFVRSEQRAVCIDERGACAFDVATAGASPYASGRSAAIPHGDATRRTGYLDREGRWVIAPRFAAGFGFREERAIVKDAEKDEYFLIDAAGERVGSESFGCAARSITLDTGWVDVRWELTAGLAPARRGDAFGFVDRSGEWAIAPRFEAVAPFVEGLAGAKLGGLWGAIDSRGAWVIEPSLERLGGFSDGLAVASKGHRIGHVNRRGEWIVAPDRKDAGTFSEGYAWVLLP